MRTQKTVKSVLNAKRLKTATFFFSAILIWNTAGAQFSTSGGSTTTMDNVGIGTTSPPGSKLYVASGYSQSGSTWTGLPALKIDWKMPSFFIDPGPSTPPPNTIEVLGITTFGSWSSVSPFMCMNDQGNLGIKAWPATGFALNIEGTTKINGDMVITKTNDSDWRNITARSNSGALHLAANNGSGDGSSIELYGRTASGREGQVRLISHGSGGYGGIQFLNYSPVSGGWATNMGILPNGQVYIGNQKPNGSFANYKLSVDGDIVCKRAVVQTNSWADFVFDPAYNLPELEEVEQYINTHKHLPGVPTEKTVLEKGIDVGDMNKILLQKVEELTLYMIEIKKENRELKNNIQELQKQ